MAEITVLDPAKLLEAEEVFKKGANQDVIADVTALAAELKKEADNAIFASLMENCKALQRTYNDEFKESCKQFLSSFEATYENALQIARTQLDSIAKPEVSFGSHRVEANL